MRPSTLLTLVLCLIQVAAADLRFDSMAPLFAPPGRTIEILGAGLDQVQELKLGATDVPIQSKAEGSLTFVVPADAVTAYVSISTASGSNRRSESPLYIGEAITGRLILPSGGDPSVYRAVASSSSVPVNGDGSFQTIAAKGRVILVSAARKGLPTAMALRVPGVMEVDLNAQTTAEAMVLLNPLTFSKDPLQISTNLTRMRLMPEFGSLVALIEENFRANRDYLKDARVDTAWGEIITRLMAARFEAEALRAQSFEPGTPPGTKFRYLNPPAGYSGYPDLHRLAVEIKPPDRQHPTDYRLSLDSAGNLKPIEQPVDWFVELYELDHREFDDGFAGLGSLTHTDNPLKLRDLPDETAIVNAKLFSGNLDLIDLAASKINEFLFSKSIDTREDFAGPNEIAIPNWAPGVYVTEAYSGNIWWGTRLFRDSPPSQAQLIEDLENRRAWTAALSANIVMASVDIISVAVPLEKLVKNPRFFQEVIYGVVQDLSKALAIHLNDLTNPKGFYDLAKTAGNSLINNLAGVAGDLEDSLDIADVTLNFVGKALDWLSKASSVLQAVERLSGLGANSVLAVERTIFVVGDPFGPAIKSFAPQQGRGGETIIIHGSNFSANTNEVKVSFCEFASTEDPTTATHTLNLPVVASTPTTIAVRVPTNGLSDFPNGKAYLCVELTNRAGLATTIPLEPPYRQFIFQQPPSLTGVYPPVVVAGGLLEIRGTNFADFSRDVHRVLVDGQTQPLYLASSNSLVIQLDQFLDPGPHSVAVKLRDYTTASISFEVREYNTAQIPNFTKGLEIRVNKGDMSNAADGRISLLEAVLIANGTLGRPVEQHLPCESLPSTDPNACPRVPREIDQIRYYGESENGTGGPDSQDYVYLDESIVGSVVTGTLPPLSSGDRYNLPLILDAAGTTAPAALILDNVEDIDLSRLTIRNSPGHGVLLRNGAFNNRLDRVRVENAGGSGLFLDQEARFNHVQGLSVSNAVLHGIHLSGSGVVLNNIQATAGRNIFTGIISPYSRMEHCGGHGILLDNGAWKNSIGPGSILSNGAAGIRITGENTDFNFIGRNSDEAFRFFDIVGNNGPGVLLEAGVHGTVLRYMNPAGNKGDGILLEGAGCNFNLIERSFTGFYLDDANNIVITANEGSGIHLKAGPQHNLIGSESAGFGDYATIVGNRDDGILLEGEQTSHNRINAQIIGVRPTETGYTALANGKSGIRITGRSHHNTVGHSYRDLQNHIYSSLEAGIVIEGAGTSHNVVSGNQLGGRFFGQFIFTSAGTANYIGVAIRGGASGNSIGLPGDPLLIRPASGFGLPEPHYFGNTIVLCSEAAISIEESGGTINTEGCLEFANLIQNNRIGELENGNLFGNRVGIKLGSGAAANMIGGPLPGDGNRIRGQYRYGIWIQNNHLNSAIMRNRFQNNLIDETTGPIRPVDYLLAPPAGIGLLIENSSGQQFGENWQTRNLFKFNRLGVYLQGSSSNMLRANLITNHFVAGVVVHGGSHNVIGGPTPDLANEIAAFGLNENGPQAGLVLSETRENRVIGNTIGYIAPGRGVQSAVLITNAADNWIGYSTPLSGNVIISNNVHGITITGAGSTGNRLANNYIGLRRDFSPAANGGSGVVFNGGAHGNSVGGSFTVATAAGPSSFVAGNVIRHSGGVGIFSEAAGSLGNSFLYNQISANGALGIDNTGGANHELPPPTYLAFDGVRVSGTVPASVPIGSRVQVFSDPDASQPEGDAYLGEGFVGAGGTWRATLTGPPLYSTISLTATHPDGSTSEFGTGAPVAVALRVFRSDETLQATTAAGTRDLPVLKLSVNPVNTDVRIDSLGLDASGSLGDNSAVLQANLFYDADESGTVTPPDFKLGGPVTFGEDNGRIVFPLTNAFVSANSTQKWVVAYDLAATAPQDARFSLAVTNAEAVIADFVFPPGAPAIPFGNFPIRSAEFTVGTVAAGQTYAAWSAAVFTAAQLADPNVSGVSADPDSDGMANLLEYAFNLDPLTADRTVQAQNDRGVPTASRVTAVNPGSGQAEEFLTVTFIRRKPPVDLIYTVEISTDLQTWVVVPGDPNIASIIAEEDAGPGGLLQKVTVRANRPINGATALAGQFVRVKVQPAN